MVDVRMHRFNNNTVRDGSYIFRIAVPEKDGGFSVSYRVSMVIAGSKVFNVPEHTTHYISLDDVEEDL